MAKKRIFVADSNSTQENPDLHAYTHIRGYHASRPIDLTSYYEKGILAPCNDKRRQVAMSIFAKTLDEILEAEDDSFADEKPQVYFTAFKEELLNDSGHYLCYGSEYLASLASYFDKSMSGICHNILLRTGIPTIFICDVPINYISTALLDDLKASYDPKNTNLGFWIDENLPAEFIVGHEHPNKIFDPFFHFKRTNTETSCSLCIHAPG